MDQRTRPPPRLAPLPPSPELQEEFEAARKRLGFVPNSMLIMQRKPKLVKAWRRLTEALADEDSKVDFGLKRLIAHMASRAAGCQYCMAHTAGIAKARSEYEQKVAAIWEYQTSPLFSEAERVTLDFALATGASIPIESREADEVLTVTGRDDYGQAIKVGLAPHGALDFALAAGSVPNAVTDEMFAAMRKYWSEEQMVEIVGVIATFGFLNRWNDTMATPLEEEPVEVGETYLARGGWSAGKHERAVGEEV